jgi:hypothetical protein
MNISSASSIRREKRLARGPKGDVWRVRTPDGRVMVAKQAIRPTRGERRQLRDLTSRGRTLGLPLVPFVEYFEAGGDAWVLRQFDPGVALSTLALNSPLSHRQAAGTAAACVQALSQLHAAGLCHGRVHAGNVFVEPDGAIRLVDAGIGAPSSRGERRSQWANDMKATAALIYMVWPDWQFEAGRRVFDLLEAGRMGDPAAACEGLELLAASVPPAESKPSADLAFAALSVRLLDAEQAKRPAPSLPAVRAPRQDVPALTTAPSVNAWMGAPLEAPPSPPPEEKAPSPPPAEKTPSPPPPSPPPVERTPAPPPVERPANLPPVGKPPGLPPVVTEPGRRMRAPVPSPMQPVGVDEPFYRWVPARPKEDSLRAAATRFFIEPARRLQSTPGGRTRRVAVRLPQGGSYLRRTPVRAAAAAAAAIATGLVIGHAVAPTWPPAGQATPPERGGGSRAQPSAQPPRQPAAPAPASATLQPAAPASAGFVRQVQLQPLGSCQTGGRCMFRSEIDLQSPHGGTAVTWDVVAVDRCTGAQSVLSSSSSAISPSWNQVWSSDQYSVPTAHPMLLYTVAVSPWRVASSPVEVDSAATCSPPA